MTDSPYEGTPPYLDHATHVKPAVDGGHAIPAGRRRTPGTERLPPLDAVHTTYEPTQTSDGYYHGTPNTPHRMRNMLTDYAHVIINGKEPVEDTVEEGDIDNDMDEAST